MASPQGPDGGASATMARGPRGAGRGGIRAPGAASERRESQARTRARTAAPPAAMVARNQKLLSGTRRDAQPQEEEQRRCSCGLTNVGQHATNQETRQLPRDFSLPNSDIEADEALDRCAPSGLRSSTPVVLQTTDDGGHRQCSRWRTEADLGAFPAAASRWRFVSGSGRKLITNSRRRGARIGADAAASFPFRDPRGGARSARTVRPRRYPGSPRGAWLRVRTWVHEPA